MPPLALAKPPISPSNSPPTPQKVSRPPRSQKLPVLLPFAERRKVQAQISSNSSVGSASSMSSLTDIEESLEWHLIKYGPRHSATCAVYNKLGNCHFRNHDLTAALQAYQAAALSETEDEHLADAYSNLGTIAWATGQVGTAMVHLRRALHIYQADLAQRQLSDSASSSLANVHHQLGLAYCLEGDFVHATNSLQKARVIREARGEHQAVAKTFEALAKVATAEGRYDAALLHYQHALGIFRITKSSMVSTLKGMAAVYARKADWNGAVLTYYELLREQKATLKAAQMSLGATTDSAKAVHDTLLALAEAYQRLEREDQAKQCRMEAGLIAQETGMVQDLGGGY